MLQCAWGVDGVLQFLPSAAGEDFCACGWFDAASVRGALAGLCGVWGVGGVWGLIRESGRLREMDDGVWEFIRESGRLREMDGDAVKAHGCKGPGTHLRTSPEDKGHEHLFNGTRNLTVSFACWKS